MQHATLTVMGVYNWDSSVFDNFVMPNGMDKEQEIGVILMECAELELLYNRPDTFKQMVGIWSNVNVQNWQKMWDVVNMEYNPIENYDRNDDFNEDYVSRETLAAEKSRSESYTGDREESTKAYETANGTKDSGETIGDKTDRTIDRNGENSEEKTTKDNGGATSEKTGSTSETVEKTTSGKEDAEGSSTETGTGVNTNTVSAFNSTEWQNKDKGNTESSKEASSSSGITSSGKENSTHSSSLSETVTGTTNNTQTVNGGNTSKEKTVDLYSAEKTIKANETTSSTNNKSIQGKGSESRSTNEVGKENENKNGESSKHNYGRSHGNIGVTTTQQMVQQELELNKFNVYNYICEQFKNQFCVVVY